MVHSSAKSRGKRPARDSKPAKGKGRATQVKEVVWDDDARREYLTGFSKRKKEQKDAARARALKKEHDEKLVLRQQLRDARRKRAADNVEMDRQYYGAGDDDADHNADIGSDPEAGPSSTQRAEEKEFSDDDLVTRVVVEDMDVAHEEPTHVKSRHIAGDNEEDENMDEDAENMFAVLAPSRIKREQAKQQDAARKAEREQKRKEPFATPNDTPVKAPVKRFTYETKAARRAEALKQKVRRIEKAEAGRGRSTGGSTKGKGSASKKTRR